MCLRSHEKRKEVKARKVSCSKVGHPSGQLPGTGIPSGIDRVCMVFLTRDSSLPERSRVRTSESGVSAGGSRPSLFDGLSSGFL